MWVSILGEPGRFLFQAWESLLALEPLEFQGLAPWAVGSAVRLLLGAGPLSLPLYNEGSALESLPLPFSFSIIFTFFFSFAFAFAVRWLVFGMAHGCASLHEKAPS